MKRMILAAVAAALLLLTGCGDSLAAEKQERTELSAPTLVPDIQNESETNSAQAAPKREQEVGVPAGFRPVVGTDDHIGTYSAYACETDTTLYFSPIAFLRSRLMYVDKATGICGPLCGKPECSHTGRDCNAHIDAMASGLTISGKRIYWMDLNMDRAGHFWSIQSCALDGSQRRTEALLADELTDSFYGRFMLDGSLAYCYGYQRFVSDGEPRVRARVYAIDLSSGQIALLMEAETAGVSAVVQLHIMGDEVYCMFFSYNDASLDSDTEPESEQTTCHLSFYRWGRTELRAEEIFDRDIDFEVWEFRAAEEGLLVSEATLFTNLSVYLVDPDTGTVRKWMDWSMDEGYISSVTFTEEYMGGFGTDGDNLPYVWIRDYTGATVLRQTILLDFMRPGTIYGRDYYLLDQDTLYYAIMDFDRSAVLHLVAVPLDGSGARILWSGATAMDGGR